MDLDVAIIVSTFGDDRWRELGRESARRAEASAPREIIVSHRISLAEARNAGAALTSAEWLCFLDADDELEPGYLEALLAAGGDLRAPAVRYVIEGEPPAEPVVFAARNISTVNPCVIGTLIRADLFERAGRFWTEPAWEDWSLFRRAWLLGAELEHVPAAVYRVNVNLTGRNSTVAQPYTLHRSILRSHARWLRLQKGPHR